MGVIKLSLSFALTVIPLSRFSLVNFQLNRTAAPVEDGSSANFGDFLDVRTVKKNETDTEERGFRDARGEEGIAAKERETEDGSA